MTQWTTRHVRPTTLRARRQNSVKLTSFVCYRIAVVLVLAHNAVFSSVVCLGLLATFLWLVTRPVPLDNITPGEVDRAEIRVTLTRVNNKNSTAKNGSSNAPLAPRNRTQAIGEFLYVW